MLATEEDIASSFEEPSKHGLFFFFGSFLRFDAFILVFSPAQTASLAALATYLPV
jgi:hypothetical protein